MPEGAPLPKVAATRGYGADVVLHGTCVEDALAGAREFAAGDRRRCFIHPFDHPDVIAGQGTVGLEIVEQCPDVRTIVVAGRRRRAGRRASRWRSRRPGRRRAG